MRKNYLSTNYTSYSYNKVSLIFALFAIILFSNSSYSQTCNLNAGNSKTICVTDGLFLTSSSFGIAPGDTDPKVVNPRWTQVSGPSVILQTPNSASTIVDGLVGGEVYEFKLTGECFDGSGDNSQNVTITVNENTLAEAGDNISGCPGVYSLSANAPNTAIGEVGEWTINGNDNAGVTIADVNSPTTTITLSDTEVGDTTLRWSITNPTQTKTCPTDDLVVITNLGGDPVVDAGPDLEAFTDVPECYTNFQSVTMSASVGGLGNGQQGTWSFVSGPALPNIVDLNDPNTVVSQLTEGSYTLRWTVNGPCATGTDTVTINVPAATQQNTSSDAGPDQVYCTPVTSTVLEGNLPLYAGETGLWTQIDSNPPVTFSDNTSNTTTVSGMSGTADYRFRWTITAPNLGNPLYECDSFDDVSVLFRNDPTTIDVNGATNTIILPTTPENPIPSSPYNSVDLPYVFSGGTSTTAALVSGPGTVVPVYTYSSGNINVSGLDDIGTYVIRITRFASGEGLTGCGSASEDITIIVSEAPGANQDMAANAGTDSVLPCGDASTTLAGNDPTATKPGVTNVYTGYWTQIDGPDVAVFTDETLYNTLVTMTTSGVYNFRWHIVSGPPGSTPSTDDTQVTVSITPNSQIIPPPTTSNLCAGDFILEATPLA